MNRRIILPSALGIAGLAVGVILGRGPLASSSAPESSGDYTLYQTSRSLLDGSAGSKGASGAGSGAGGAANGGGGSTSPVADALLGVINNPNGQQAVNRFYQMLAGMPSQDIARLIVDIDSYPNHSRRRETREMIIDYLAMADPKKALEVREELPNKGIFSKAMRQLGRNNPAEALRMRESITDSKDRSSALRAIFVGASEVDPAGAFALLLKTEDAGPQHYEEVFDNWAETDPVTAAKMALTVTKPAERREALKIVGQEWAERDPKAVLDWLGRTELSSYEREIMRNSAINAYAKRDAKAAMELIAGMDSTTRNRALPSVVRELIEEDPSAAVDWIRNEPDGFAKYRAINETTWVFANEAPELAIELAKEIPEMKDNALRSAFSTLASRDLDIALEMSQEWADDSQYSRIMREIASGYGRENPEEALKWANTLDDNVRSSAISSVVSRLANNDPTLALEHLDGLGLAQDDPIYNNAMQNIASNWASQDPVSAAEWLDTLPDSQVRNSAVGDIADRWARIDPVSASEWIGTLDEGPGRDSAASRLVNRIQREDPEMAAAWASSIGDENMRNNALTQVFHQWRRMDPEGARAAAEASILPDAMKQQFTNPGNPGAAAVPTPSTVEDGIIFSGGMRLR